MVTVTSGQSLVAVKAHKEFRTEIGAEVFICVPEASCHLFDSQTGERLESGASG
jgi:multiple sugar transport system ATP-binding protein